MAEWPMATCCLASSVLYGLNASCSLCWGQVKLIRFASLHRPGGFTSGSGLRFANQSLT